MVLLSKTLLRQIGHWGGNKKSIKPFIHDIWLAFIKILTIYNSIKGGKNAKKICLDPSRKISVFIDFGQFGGLYCLILYDGGYFKLVSRFAKFPINTAGLGLWDCVVCFVFHDGAFVFFGFGQGKSPLVCYTIAWSHVMELFLFLFAFPVIGLYMCFVFDFCPDHEYPFIFKSQ
jgi:hypothetical protein